MAGTGSSVVLAQVTTAATFFALLLIDFPTLQDLGSLVGLGILLCCGLTLLLLPALLPRRTDAQSGRALTARVARTIRDARARRRSSGPASSPRSRSACGVARLPARHEHREAAGADARRRRSRRQSPTGSRCRTTCCWCSTNAIELEPLLETDARLTRALADALPSVVAERHRRSCCRRRRTQAAVAPSRSRDRGTTGDDARREIEAAARRAGFRPDTFAPFLERLPRLLDPAERITYDGLIAHGLESDRLAVRRSHATAATSGDVPVSAAARRHRRAAPDRPRRRSAICGSPGCRSSTTSSAGSSFRSS